MEAETRRIDLPLECRLTEPEIKAAGKELAEALNHKTRIENELETFKQQKKAEVAAIDAIIARNTVLVNSEKEFRTVECEQRYDFDNALKTITRLDTGEIVRSEAITNAERQQLMPGVV